MEKKIINVYYSNAIGMLFDDHCLSIDDHVIEICILETKAHKIFNW